MRNGISFTFLKISVIVYIIEDSWILIAACGNFSANVKKTQSYRGI